MKIIGVIPSRLQSTRLPQKAVVDIEGLPMIVHVFKRARLASSLSAVYVATDSPEIRDIVVRHGGEALMTSPKHQTGTDRIAEAVKDMDADIVVNIQGDEPLLNPAHIDRVVQPFKEDNAVQVAVLVTPYRQKKSFSDIKAVVDAHNNILYCSRTDLPYDTHQNAEAMWKMCFMVPFRKAFLLKYAAMERTPLEKVESNEYLRILEHGHKIKAVPVDNAHISVDTPEDLNKVRAIMRKDKIKEQYAPSVHI